jgi:hypothetical protein
MLLYSIEYITSVATTLLPSVVTLHYENVFKTKIFKFFKILKKQMQEIKAPYVGDHFETKRIVVALKITELINF